MKVYNAADVFVLPSLSVFPIPLWRQWHAVIPSVGFRVGGIPEMNHCQNGYVANYKDAADLAKGIRWALDEADHEEVKKACLTKVAHNYSQQSVAKRYMDIYESMVLPQN